MNRKINKNLSFIKKTTATKDFLSNKLILHVYYFNTGVEYSMQIGKYTKSINIIAILIQHETFSVKIIDSLLHTL